MSYGRIKTEHAGPKNGGGASVDVGKDPWTDPDPQPGDFDAELDRARSEQIEMHEGNPQTKLSILAGQASCIAYRYAIQRYSDPK